MGKGKDYYGRLSRGQSYNLFMMYITPGASDHFIIESPVDTSLHEFWQSSGGSKKQMLRAN